MAQGFDRKLNLSESTSQISDRTILDNLGGENITSDILLFDGNSKFTSKLINSEYALSPDVTKFSDGFEPGEIYFIEELGSDRDWNAVSTPPGIITHAPSGRENSFTAVGGVSDTVLNTGSGGTARKMVVRQDFQVFQDEDGYALRAVGVNKVGFTNGTKLSLDGGETYTLLVAFHDSENVFRLIDINTSPPFDAGDIVNPNTLGDIANMTLTRSDTITAEHLEFMNAERLVVNDEIGVTSPENQGQSETENEGLGGTAGDEGFLSSFSSFDQIGYVGNLASQIKFKKSRIPRTYEDSFFEESVRIGGSMQILNTDQLEIGYPRNLDSALVVGKVYKITTRGDATTAQLNAISGESRESYNENDTFTAATTSTASGTTTRVKANEPPGLFIYNSSSGEEVRAFSGTEQPWEELDSTDGQHPTDYVTSGNSLRTSTQKIDVRREPLYINPTSGNSPVFSRANYVGGNGTHAPQATTPVQTNTEDSYTHKIGITVNGEQYYMLTKKQ